MMSSLRISAGRTWRSRRAAGRARRVPARRQDGGPQYELEKDAVQRYERTALELSTKADKDHDHAGGGDHEHDDLAKQSDLLTEQAARKQGDADLQQQINDATSGNHTHTQYAETDHGHGEFSLSDHTHPEYEGGGGGGGDVTKAYVDTQDQNEAKAREDADKALSDRIDGLEPFDPSDINDALDLKFDKAGGDLLWWRETWHEPSWASWGANTLYEGTAYSHPQALINSAMMKEYAAEKEHDHELSPPVHVGDDEPGDPEEGDLWYDTDRLEMFIYYDGGWITTNALGARIEAGEEIQRDLQVRVAAGEAEQEILQAKVNALEGSTGTHPYILSDNGNPHEGPVTPTSESRFTATFMSWLLGVQPERCQRARRGRGSRTGRRHDRFRIACRHRWYRSAAEVTKGSS